MNSGDTIQHGADLPSWQSVAGGRSQKDILSTLSRQAPNQVSERKFAKNVLKRFSRRPAVEERGSGEKNGSQGRVSPRSRQPSNTPSAKHRPPTESPLGKRLFLLAPAAVESNSDPYAAPAPCRTQGVRGGRTRHPPPNSLLRPAVEERGSGRESGSQERVSPRSKQPSNTPSAEHHPATESPLGKRRSGAKTRSDLSAEKREDRFVFLRLFLLAPADRSRVRLRPVHGTGTLPDAGGAGGGGHATRLPRPRNAPQRGTLPDAGGAGGGGHATRLPRPRGA